MSGYAYTYGGPSAFLGFVLLAGLPVLYARVLRRRRARVSARLGVLLGVWLLAVLVAYTDVLVIARHAARLCASEAGLRVHRPDSAAGFLGDTDFAHWALRGFEFVEWRRHDGSLVRYTAEGSLPVVAPRARHELVLESDPAGPRIERRRWVMRVRAGDASAREVLGTYTQFEIGPGWLDRLLIAVSGLPWSPPNCAGTGAAATAAFAHGRRALVEAVLRPAAGDRS